MKNNYFTKNETNLIKGVAIILLLTHHLFNGNLATPVHLFGGDSIIKIFATLCKVCVTIFLILSGYGLNESYKNKSEQTSNMKFVLHHLANLMKQFWWIFVLFVPLGFLLDRDPILIYGIGINGGKNFVLDFLGLSAIFNTATMNQSWWYMEAIIVCYLLFPLFRVISKKIPITTIILCYIPVILNKVIANDNWYNCREIFWFMPFVLGIVLSQKDILNTFIKKSNTYKIRTAMIVVIALLLSTFLRLKFGIIFDPIFGLCIICITIIIFNKENIFKKAFVFLGKHSGNIYMFHSFIYYYFSWASILYLINSSCIRLIVLLLECIIISVIIEEIKKVFEKIYTKLINKCSKI